MVTPERYERISSLFLAAADLAGGERVRLLDRECAGDPELRADVERMLAREAEALAAPVASLVPPAILDPVPEAWGNYRVLETLGKGGMGTVYRAEQLRPHRIVALKVIRADRTTPEMARRFASEAEILGSLRHPGIAQILEAGSIPTPFGELPFIAMEWIDGPPLLAHAKERGLGIRERLALLARICGAVDFAHRRGVVHRDLKPDNILVEASGQPKVLDFGIARVTDPALRPDTLQTEAGQLLGTLPYMSPEQVAGSAIDLRTDVYSLGVIGYELLGGRLPHDLAGTDLESALRTIRDELPTPLDTLDPRLRGDVATIIGKALEKDPARRYAAAAELAADLERHLAARPILARRPSRLYQIDRFARRNRVLVAGSIATLLALVAGLAGTLWMAFTAMRERDIAREQTEVAEAVNEFLELDLLRQADPESTPDRNLTVRAALDAAAAKVGTRFAERPRVEAAIRSTIGSTYSNLGLNRPALEHLERADELQARLLARGDEEHLRTRFRLAKCRELLGDLLRALRDLESLLADFDGTRPGTIDELRLDAELLRVHTLVALGRTEEARPLVLGLRAPVAEAFGAGSGESEQVEVAIAWLASDEGRHEEAQASFDAAAERSARELGPDDPVALRRALEAATVLHLSGRNREARPDVEDLLERHRRVLGEEHPRTIQAMRLLAVILESLDESVRGRELQREVLEIRRRTLGEDHPDTLVSWTDEALALKNAGELAEAERIYRSVLEARLAVLAPGHTGVTNIRNNLAMLHWSAGRYPEALALLDESLAASLEAVGEDHPVTLRTRYYRGFVLRNLGRDAEAEQEYRLALAGQETRLGDRHRDTLNTLNNLAYLCRLGKRYEEAEALYLRALAGNRATFGETHDNVSSALQTLGDLHLEREDAARALACFEEAATLRTAAHGEESTLAQGARLRAWRALDRLGRHEEALALAHRSEELLRASAGDADDRGRLHANALLAAGISSVKIRQWEGAETALLAARARHLEIGGPEAKEFARAESWLRALYEKWGRPEDAARYPAHEELE